GRTRDGRRGRGVVSDSALDDGGKLETRCVLQEGHRLRGGFAQPGLFCVAQAEGKKIDKGRETERRRAADGSDREGPHVETNTVDLGRTESGDRANSHQGDLRDGEGTREGRPLYTDGRAECVSGSKVRGLRLHSADGESTQVGYAFGAKECGRTKESLLFDRIESVIILCVINLGEADIETSEIVLTRIILTLSISFPPA